MAKILNALTDLLLAKLNGIATGAQVNVKSDWNAVTGDAEILNKPAIGVDKFRTAATFSKNANLAAGNYMVLGEVTSSLTKGWILPQDLTIEAVTICRTDSDAADIEIVCDGVVKATVATADTNTVDDTMSVACLQGEVLSVRNKSGGNTISNTVVVVWLEGTI